MIPPPYIVAAGARTPIGLHAASTAAAFRAGVSALVQHPFMVDRVGDAMSGALDAELDPRLMGPERMVSLAETALREACTPFDALAAARPALPVFLALPEVRPGFSHQDAHAVREGLMAIAGLPIGLSEISIFPEGHAAGLSALAAAVDQIGRGACEACLVGGVDSYFEPDTMEWLDANRQLAGAVSRSGFVPGEAAGFCLLMAEGACAQLGAGSLARVLAVSLQHETKLIKSSDIHLGEALSEAVRAAVACLDPEAARINRILCDINGERYRSEEWGFVCLRLSQYFDDVTAYESPAECWGDVGAASGPLWAMLVCQAAVRGRAKGPHTMLWASSERGLRGVAVLETPMKG